MDDLVAINGLGGLTFMWAALREALPSRAWRLLDLPGHGDLPAAADYHYAALVDDVARRTEDLPAFDLVGWSVGAAVAWLFAARHPGRVRRLVLIEPAAPHQSPFREGPTPEPIHTFTFASVEKAVGALRSIDPSTTEADVIRAYRQNDVGRWEPRYDAAILPALVEDARELGEAMYFELERIAVPVLIVRGSRSFLDAARVEEIAAVIPDARIETVQGAGHFVVKERPADVAALLASFLGRVDIR